MKNLMNFEEYLNENLNENFSLSEIKNKLISKLKNTFIPDKLKREIKKEFVGLSEKQIKNRIYNSLIKTSFTSLIVVLLDAFLNSIFGDNTLLLDDYIKTYVYFFIITYIIKEEKI